MKRELEELMNRPIPSHAGEMKAKTGYRDHPIDFDNFRGRGILVDVRSFGIDGVNYYHLEKDNPPYNHRIPGSIPDLFVRYEVAERLVLVNKRLHRFGLKLFVRDGWRPQAVQSHCYYTWFPNEVRKLHPTWTDGQVMEETRKYWSPGALSEALVDRNSPPPHSTGVAVDLILMTLKGVPVPMGSDFDQGIERSHMDFLEYHDCDPMHRAYRRVFYHVMTEAGFIGNPTEWWHWSFRDQMAARIMSYRLGHLVRASFTATQPWV